jgi:hypothetical protein
MLGTSRVSSSSLARFRDVFGRAAPDGLADRDTAADFVTHSYMREPQCSMPATVALAVEANGLVFDEETESLIPPEQLLEQARTIDLAYALRSPDMRSQLMRTGMAWRTTSGAAAFKAISTAGVSSTLAALASKLMCSTSASSIRQLVTPP